MAGEAAGGAAFIRLQTPDNSIGQALQFWGAQDAKRVEGDKLAEERAGIRKSKEVADWEESTNLKAETFKNKYTGFKSADDMYTDFSLYSTDEYVKAQRAAKDSMLRGDARGKAEAEGRMMVLKNNFSEVAKAQPRLAQISEEYRKAAQEGKVSAASKEFEDIMKAGTVDHNLAIREVNGVLSYTGLTDEGKPVVVPYQDIFDGSFGYIEKQIIDGKEGLVEGVANTLGTITKEGYSGYSENSSQVWDDKIHGDATRKAVDAMMGTDDVMADLLAQVSKGKIIKRKDFNEEDYKLVKDNLEARIKASYSEKVSSKFNNAKYNADLDARIARERMAAEERAARKPKPKSAEETEYGARRFNIGEVTKGDTSFFNTGDFKWGGQDYVSQGAKLIGDNIVIQVGNGEVIKVPKNNETAINNLLNSFEKKTTTFDKVMSVDAYPWRDSRVDVESDVTSMLAGQYSPTGKFIGEETDFIKNLKEIYPDIKTEEAGWGKNKVIVNGQEIDLDNMSKEEVEAKVRSAVGEKAKTGTKLTPQELIRKYGNK